MSKLADALAGLIESMNSETLQKYVLGTTKSGNARSVYDVIKEQQKQRRKELELTSSDKKKKKKKKKGKKSKKKYDDWYPGRYGF
jgi:phage protein D